METEVVVLLLWKYQQILNAKLWLEFIIPKMSALLKVPFLSPLFPTHTLNTRILGNLRETDSKEIKNSAAVCTEKMTALVLRFYLLL